MHLRAFASSREINRSRSAAAPPSRTLPVHCEAHQLVGRVAHVPPTAVLIAPSGWLDQILKEPDSRVERACGRIRRSAVAVAVPYLADDTLARRPADLTLS